MTELQWTDMDPAPGKPLESIHPLSQRALAAIARAWSGPIEMSELVRLQGVTFMLAGLEYHYANMLRSIAVMKLDRRLSVASDHFVHEAVAYLNRVGQFYCFATSDFVTTLLGDKAATLPLISKVLRFRHKHTAHRSLDKPFSGDIPGLVEYHAMFFQGGTFITGPRSGVQIPDVLDPSYLREFWRFFMPGFQLNLGHGTVLSFIPERDHSLIIQEAYSFIERLADANSAARTSEGNSDLPRNRPVQ